ncbi:hypothetical protein CMK18_23930 [Candidatus Poribacteria bacterium]|nr:hypothetical protein [Candidatus Poribacteria bacterium]
MNQYFNEESVSRIAETVRIVENTPNDIPLLDNSVLQTSTLRLARIPPSSSSGGGQPISVENQVLRIDDCEIWVYNDAGNEESPEYIRPAPGEEPGEGVLLAGPVYFLYPPEKNTWFPICSMGGKSFAIQSRVFPVKLLQTGGDPGDHLNQCSFTYDVYTCAWGAGNTPALGSLLSSGVDPTSVGAPGGCITRTEIGSYIAADFGVACIAGNSNFKPFILSCNEIIEVAACDAATPSAIRWGGIYSASKTYDLNTLVQDGNYQMVSKTSTQERPAPQPIGEPTTKMGTEPTWANVSGAGLEIITGQRYTWASGGMVSKVKAYVPLTSGVQYEVWIVEDPTGTPILNQLVSRFTADSTGWKEFPFVKLFSSGTVFDVLLVVTSTGQSTSLTASWNYQSANTDPAANYSHHTLNGTTLKFNHTDNGSSDRETALEAMRTGDTITIGSTIWTIVKTTAGASVHTYEILPQYQHATKGVGSFVFKAITSGTIQYITKSGHYSGDSEVQGLLSTTGFSNVSTSNDGFGVDIEYQPMSVSADWELLSFNGDSLEAV